MFCVSRGWWYHDSDSTKEWNNLNKTVSAKLNKFLNHGAYKHAFTKLKEVLESFGIRVVSSFSFFRLKGLPSLSPHLKHYATPNMTMVFGKMESTRYFFLNGYPNAINSDKSKKTSLFSSFRSQNFKGISHHGACNSPTTHRLSVRSPGRRIHDANLFFHFFPLFSHRISIPLFWKTTLEEKWLIFGVLCS